MFVGGLMLMFGLINANVDVVILDPDIIMRIYVQIGVGWTLAGLGTINLFRK